jgi:hypothetical protein
MNPTPSRTMVATLLVAAGGLLAACETGANGTPQVETITVAAQDTTPPEFAAMVEIENGKQGHAAHDGGDGDRLLDDARPRTGRNVHRLHGG